MVADSRGAIDSTTVRINERGDVAGTKNLSSQYLQAYRWTAAGGMQDLPTLGYDSAAYAINARGQVAGYSVTLGGDWHATLWTP